MIPPSTHRRSRGQSWTGALVLVLASIAGCGPSDKDSKAASTAKSPQEAIRCVATHAFGGSPEASHVTALCLSGKTLFVGTQKRLFSLVYDSKLGRFETTPDAKDDPASGTGFAVRSIRADGKQVFVATHDGLSIYDGKSWTAESLGPVNDIVNYDGVLWIGRNRGLERRTGTDWKEETIPATPDSPFMRNRTLCHRIHGLAVTPDGRLWVGSEFGIFGFLAKEKRWGFHQYGDYQNIVGDLITNEKGNSSLCGNQINRLDVDPDSGRLLICTQTGLSVFDGKDSWKTVQGDYEILSSEGGTKVRIKKKGNCDIPSPNVVAATFAGGDVWIGTSSGLVMVHGDKTRLFDTDAGLPSGYITCLAYDPRESVLFVGTEKGIAAMSPIGGSGSSKATEK